MLSKNTFYLAPLRGITDYIFRNAFERHFGKFDFLFTPFIPTVKGDTVNPSHIRDVNPQYNDVNRVVPQIIGNDALDIILLSNHLANLGYNSVNLNLGCPHPQITRKKRGSGLLPYPDMIDALLNSIFSDIKCNFSVKVRLGLNDSAELEKVVPILNRYPISEVIIHSRTGLQMYDGTTDLNSFLKYQAMLSHYTVYNGDIWSLEYFERYSTLFPSISRWMLGRGVVQNPFLLEELKSSLHVKKEKYKLRSFHDEIFALSSEKLSGPSHLLGKMKELWAYISGLFTNQKKILKLIQKRTSIDSYISAVNETFIKEHLLD